MSDTDIRKIFDIIPTNDEEQDKLNTDILVMNAITDADNKIDYLSQCFFERGRNNIVFQYLRTYILVDMEGDTVQLILNHIKESNLNFVEEFFAYLVKDKKNKSSIDIIESFKLTIREIPYGTERLNLLEILFKSKFIRENMWQEIYQNGMTNETKGYFSLFTDSLEKDWNINIDPIKPLLNLFIADNESCSKLVKYVQHLLNLNIAYSYENSNNLIQIKKCASIKHVCFLTKVMIYIFESFKSNLQEYASHLPHVMFDINQRTNYEINGNNLITQIVIVCLLALKISYVPLAKIYYAVKAENEMLKELKLVMNTNELKYNRIKGIFFDENFHSSMLNFVDCIVAYNVFIFDDSSQNITDFLIGCIIDHKMKMLPTNTVNYILRAINGTYGLNKHTRFNACSILVIICDRIGYDFFSDLDLENDLFFSLLKLIITVDHFEWTELITGHKIYQSMLKLLAFCSSSLVPNSPEENCGKNFSVAVIEKQKNAELLLHKITTKMNSIITDMMKLFDNLSKNESNFLASSREKYKPLVMEFIKTLMVSTQVLQALINNNIINIKTLPLELILPISALSISLLRLLSDGKGLIYTVFQMNMETLDLMQELFKLINIGCSNENFLESIKDNVNIIKEMIYMVKLDSSMKNSLNTYLGHLDTNKAQDDKDNDLPEEFKDSILATVINRPVMIPKIDTIFDRSSIMSHLYNEETNPFTRDPLTISEFEEYNQRDDVKEKINNFINRLNDFKKTNKQ